LSSDYDWCNISKNYKDLFELWKYL
jgi:hypothetical protein